MISPLLPCLAYLENKRTLFMINRCIFLSISLVSSALHKQTPLFGARRVLKSPLQPIWIPPRIPFHGRNACFPTENPRSRMVQNLGVKTLGEEEFHLFGKESWTKTSLKRKRRLVNFTERFLERSRSDTTVSLSREWLTTKVSNSAFNFWLCFQKPARKSVEVNKWPRAWVSRFDRTAQDDWPCFSCEKNGRKPFFLSSHLLNQFDPGRLCPIR